MPHRMDIELTSSRDDESFTWRAAGAREPKGVLGRSLLPAGAKVGDVIRVEAEIEIDGLTIVSVLPSKEKTPPRGKIEVIGSSKPTPWVTTVLAGRTGRGRPERGRTDRGRPDQGCPDQGRAEPGRAQRRSERPPRDEEERAARRSAGGPERERPLRSREGERQPRERPSERSLRAGAGARGGGERGAAPRGAAEREPRRRGPARLEPGTKHRDELFASLSSEHRPIAERLAAGGLPALRKAIAEEQQRARADGRPLVSGEPLIAVAEQLMPDVQGALWLDRAEAAVERMDEISLRDLRTAVAGAAPRDEAARELHRRLREGLDKRVANLRADWEEHISKALEDGRVLQALRLSGRAPEPTARFPSALVEPLAAQASTAMTAETAPDRWLALLEAAVASPVRRQIKPGGLPKDDSGEVERQARLAAGRLPALAPLLGMAMPPPPQPLGGERAPRRVPRPPRQEREPHPGQPHRPERPAQQARPVAQSTGEPPTPGGTAAAEPSSHTESSGSDDSVLDEEVEKPVDEV